MRNALRKGFTLLEMLVTLILLGILVAVVFPVVTQQIEDADPVKAANDLANIRTGIEIFHLNVRPYYPADLDDLANPIVALTDGQLKNTASTYSTDDVDLWNGPYIDATVAEDGTAQATGDALGTGYGAKIQNNLVMYDKTNDCAKTAGTCGTATYDATKPQFAAVMIGGLSSTQAQAINDLIDGDDEGATWLSEGRVRFNNDIATTDYLFYLAVPVK